MTVTAVTPPRSDIPDLHGPRGLWIGGRDRPSADHRTFCVLDPASGRLVAEVADGTPRDAQDAVDAAERAAAGWADTAPRQRSEVLRRAFDLMLASAEQLAALIAQENGKSLTDARAEIGYAGEFFRWYAEEAVRSDGEFGVSPAGGTRTVVTHKPVGVAALVTPWNFPAAMATRKIAPALAAGCTVVLKPAAETPLTALAIARVLADAGLPDGAVNVLPTTDAAGIVSAWLDDPRVRKLSFTGSTVVGRRLLAQAARRVVNTSMELGGNAPFIVTADADIQAAVEGAMIAKFRNGGQACTAANRFYVHADVLAEFTARFGAAVEALAVGAAGDGTSQMGPLISDTARDGVAALVDRAVNQGARISHRGATPSTGWFYPPTVLVDVPADAEILFTEIFGPVAAVVSWTEEQAMLRLANATELGLAAYVYAGDLGQALRIGERLEAGMVGVNRGVVSDPATPFGGVKQSGIGREGAREGLRAFQEAQYLSVDWASR